jgi:aspartokinase
MSHQTRLGGFKLLNDVVWISLLEPERDRGFPAEFCNLLAGERINLLFLTCGNQNGAWGLDIVADPDNADKVFKLIEEHFEKIKHETVRGAVLSLFPHKSDPEITASLLNVFGREGIEPNALAYSNSAISAVLRKEIVDKATKSLFEPFSFSAYRTPADWKLAQKGKEQLYKEVVASYQEKQPKVYALEWQDGQELLRVSLGRRDLGVMGDAFRDFSGKDRAFSFLVSNPSSEKTAKNLLFCLPESGRQDSTNMIRDLIPETLMDSISPVAVFSMNGPHFGDRYGIASELLTAFDNARIDLLALSCSIHSITGVVPANQGDSTISAIQACFEVPSVIRKP